MAALLFGALLSGTSQRNLDPTIFEPELASNLTSIIQGLVVLIVSADVIVLTMLRRGRSIFGRRPPAVRRQGGRGVSTAVATAAPPGRSSRATRAGPASRWASSRGSSRCRPRSCARPAPSILIGLLAMTAGGWAIARRGAQARLGRGRGRHRRRRRRVASTQSGVGNLKDVVTWSALVAATLRYATPLIFGALGGIVSERSGVVNVGLEGMMLTGAFFGIFGADLLDSWFLGLLVGMAAGGAARVACTPSSRSTCAPIRSSAASRSISSPPA